VSIPVDDTACPLSYPSLHILQRQRGTVIRRTPKDLVQTRFLELPQRGQKNGASELTDLKLVTRFQTVQQSERLWNDNLALTGEPSPFDQDVAP
jgi:hypothetical protein